MLVKTLRIACLCATASAADGWIDLIRPGSFEGWQVVGGGMWSVTSDGLLIGQADPKRPFPMQSWLYTEREFTSYDLSLEYWIRLGSNSGVSIGDRSRGRYAVSGPLADPKRTPARIAYEINIDNGDPVAYDITGSIYLIAAATPGVQKPTDWNTLEIEVRPDHIKVRLNGKQVAAHAGLSDRSKAGPIGLQLHDSKDVVIYRNMRIRLLDAQATR